MRLIDADSLRTRMYHEAFETDSDMQKWDSGCWIRYKMFENAIENAPTIEPKKGKWIKHSIGHEHTPWGFDCSECGEWLVVGEEIVKKYNYCPNCGCSMKGETDERN